jgi:hypothetical protein
VPNNLEGELLTPKVPRLPASRWLADRAGAAGSRLAPPALWGTGVDSEGVAGAGDAILEVSREKPGEKRIHKIDELSRSLGSTLGPNPI